MPKKLNAVDVVNAVNNQIKKVYNVQLPAVSKANFSDMASALRAVPEQVQNDWQNSLINLVGLQIVKNKRQYESYFRKLHLEPIATFDVQLQMTDLIAAKTYSPNADSADFFEDEQPDIKTQYVNSVVKLKFPVSINDESLYGAFLSTAAFDSFLNSVEVALWSSLEMADVTITKEMITANIEQGNVFLIPLAKPSDQASALAFTKEMKQIANDMKVEMSGEYNLSGLSTWTPEEDGMIFSDTEVEAVTDVYSLAWAFNKSLLELKKDGQFITMAKDALAGGAVYAVYADRYAFEIREIVGFPKVAQQYFGNTLTSKRWLHYWALYAMSFFNNVAAFIKPDMVGITSATLATDDGLSAYNRNSVAWVKVASVVAPSGKYADKFGVFTLSGNNSDKTMIDAHSGKLIIAPDETATSLTVTWTSHLDDTVTATKAITVNN